nr:hypothetical protein [Sphaerotilus sp.]
DAYVYRRGFFNDHLRLTLDRLPLHLWSAPRRKRDYVSSVLAPDGSPADGDRFIWRPVYDVLNLPWVDQGTGHEGEQMSGWRFSSLVSSLLK